MSEQFVSISYTILADLARSKPLLPSIQFWQNMYPDSDGIVHELYFSTQTFEIPANQSSDYSLPVTADTRTILTMIINTDTLSSEGDGSVTAKVNGGTDLFPICPRMIIGGDLTAIAARNSATSSVDVVIAKLIGTTTPNITTSPRE